MTVLAAAFLITAILYAMVGFGGGSTYNALLVLAGTDYQLLPALALTCNITVVAGGAYHFSRGGQVRWLRLLPFVVFSVPLAWMGGRLEVPERTFVGLLGFALLVSALGMVVRHNPETDPGEDAGAARNWLFGLPVGAATGLLAGMVGIGGGVFLAPLLHLLHWGRARAIAAASSVFILVNSLAGLLGQVMKLGDLQRLGDFQRYWWLLPAVLVGGQIGSRIGSRRLPGRALRTLTAILVAFVAVRLLHRWYVTG